ncbi:hypothetical protein VNO78_12146 [Psophocarpus tetragonolobus]|uniref:Uncharacterized protein n=1 Tax=Psophocarpus tetragonolobus TaxID=3891 RepID=A0AAN9XP64_PSOTE
MVLAHRCSLALFPVYPSWNRRRRRMDWDPYTSQMHMLQKTRTTITFPLYSTHSSINARCSVQPSQPPVPRGRLPWPTNTDPPIPPLIHDAPGPLLLEQRVVLVQHTRLHSVPLDRRVVHLQPLDDNVQPAGNHQPALFSSAPLDHLANASQLLKTSTIRVEALSPVIA